MANNTMQRLMQQPAAVHDVPWLQAALQAAIQLELATLPPYLSAMFSIADQASAGKAGFQPDGRSTEHDQSRLNCFCRRDQDRRKPCRLT